MYHFVLLAVGLNQSALIEVDIDAFGQTASCARINKTSKDQVFMDGATIPLGVDLVEYLESLARR